MNYIHWAELQDKVDGEALGTSSVKQKNRGLILKALITEGSQSRAELARKTQLSPPTVSRIIAELVADNIIHEDGVIKSGDVGAPGSMLSFNAGGGFVIGVNVGESVIQCALANLEGKVIDVENAQTKARLGGERTVEQIADTCIKLINKNNVMRKSVLCLGVGVPGTVNIDNDGVLRVNAPDINGWMQFPLKQMMLERTGIPDIFIENAQNVAVICEHAIGCAVNCSDVVFIHVKAGIGAGVLLNGALFRGRDGKSGEIGFCMPSLDCAPPEISANHPRHGALENKIGLCAILQEAGISISETNEDLLDLEGLYQQAKDGDMDLYAVISRTWSHLGMLAVNICSLLNPQMIVLGGDILPLGKQVRNTVEQYVRSYCLSPCEVKLSAQGNQTCMLGAVQLACTRVYRKLGVQ